VRGTALARAGLDALARTLSRAAGRPPLDLDGLLASDARIVEVGAGDLRLAEALAARGACVLALARVASEEARGELEARHPGLAGALFRCEHASQVGENNAEILVLSDPALAEEGLPRRHRQARIWIFAPAGGPAAWRAARAVLRGVRAGPWRGRLRFLGAGAVRAAGSARLGLAFENLTRRPESPRRHLAPAVGLERFCATLEEGGVRYAILRWFEALPAFPPGEDVDLLVADEDVPAVEGLFARRAGLLPFDLYSVSGLPGTAHRRMAYFPPAAARALLERSVVRRPPFRVPCPEDHFRSLAYHALYHKGEASGIPSAGGGPGTGGPPPEHDYTGRLAELARTLRIPVRITFEDLDAYLASEGWRPPLDALARLARRNRWAAARVAELVGTGSEAYRGLVVFFLRRRALELGFAEEISTQLAEAGFTVLLSRKLAAEARERVERQARGGNWGPGPFPRSGGPPELALVAYDAAPLPPTPAERARHPGLENGRLRVKEEIRDRLNARLPPPERCNWLHSSDNAWGAAEYLRLALPDALPSIFERVEQLRAAAAGRRPDPHPPG
jgi:hypothetical protein